MRKKRQPCNACKPCGIKESLPYKTSSRHKARKRFKHIKRRFSYGQAQRNHSFKQAVAGRIIGIELEPASAFEGLTKDVDLKITWDGEAQPAVYCPVADLFGYAFGQTSMQSLLIGTSGRKNYCYFPMPFDRSAKIELVYRKRTEGTNALAVTARVFYTTRPRNSNSEGKFYAHGIIKRLFPCNSRMCFWIFPGKDIMWVRCCRPGDLRQA
jgi:hypothetical protein